MTATFQLEVLDANGAVQGTSTFSRPKAFGKGWWGWNKCINREEAAQSGLLAGDSLRLRVTVMLAG